MDHLRGHQLSECLRSHSAAMLRYSSLLASLWLQPAILRNHLYGGLLVHLESKTKSMRTPNPTQQPDRTRAALDSDPSERHSTQSLSVRGPRVGTHNMRVCVSYVSLPSIGVDVPAH